MSKCKKCISDRTWCSQCRDYPVYQEILKMIPKKSCYMDYVPVCPRGYTDCVCDPGYIKFHHPEWYKDLYGDLSPEEAILVEGGCKERFLEDPDEKYYCYDDEDK